MESYFSRMKTILLPMVALTKNYATANDFTFVTADYKQYIIKLKKYDVEVED